MASLAFTRARNKHKGNVIAADFESLQTQIAEEKRVFVNVAKIRRVIQAKIGNSKLAFSFLRYFCFLCLYCAAVIMQREPSNSLGMTAALTNYFLSYQFRDTESFDMKGFMDLQTTADFWKWLEIYFVDAFYQENYYNGDPLNSLDQNTLLQFMKKTGGFRILQRRALPDSCPVLSQYALFLPECYGELLLNGLIGPVDKAPFKGTSSGQLYNHTSSDVWVDPGYFYEFPKGKAETLEQIRRLKADSWISKATQYIRLDFAVYNPNVGQFARVTFELVISPTGKFIPDYYVSCRRYDFYQTGTDFIRLALEFAVVAGWLCYAKTLIGDMISLKRQAGTQILASFFFDAWNAIDILHILCLAMIIATWIFIVLDPTMNKLVITPTKITMPNGNIVDFSTTSLAIDFYFAVNGFNMLISILRVLKFLRMNAFMGQLTDAFQLMMPSVAQFIVLLFIFLFIFTAIATLLFGAAIEDFASTLNSIDLIMGFSVGWADPFELFDIDPNAAIFFYYPFTFLNACFILPLTVAIIMEAYGLIKDAYETAKAGDLAAVIDLPFYAQVYRGMVRIFGSCLRIKSARLEMPSKMEANRIFSDFNAQELVLTSEMKKHFEEDGVTEWDLVERIIDKYQAFQAHPSIEKLLGKPGYDSKGNAIVGGVSEAMEKSFFKDMKEMDYRISQLLADQEAMHRKVDLLTSIFQPALITE